MPSTEEVRQQWDAFAAGFEAYVEPMTTLTGRQLLAALRLDECKALLEVGAGAGGLAVVTRELLPVGARHVVTDLTPTMVSLAAQKLGAGADVRVADAQALPFADGEFDRLLANFNLMLVPEADLALAEAVRVVAPGGLCAWSVWGRPENSPMMTIPVEAMKRAGAQVPVPPRSNFYLAPRERVVERIRAAGFADVRGWYVQQVVHVRDGAQFADDALTKQPRYRAMLKDVPADTIDAVRREMAAMAEAVLADGRAIGLEVCCVVARRP